MADLIELLQKRLIETAFNNVGYVTDASNIYLDVSKRLKDWIEEVPTAEPQIIRCKYCKYQNKGQNESESWNLCGYRPWLYIPTNDDHFCGYAERRQDGNSK